MRNCHISDEKTLNNLLQNIGGRENNLKPQNLFNEKWIELLSNPFFMKEQYCIIECINV